MINNMWQKRQEKFELMPPGEPIRKKIEKQKKKEDKKKKEMLIKDQRKLEKKALRLSYSSSTKTFEDQIRQKLAKRKIHRSSDKHNSNSGSNTNHQSIESIPVTLELRIVERLVNLLLDNGAVDEIGIFRVSGRFQFIQLIYKAIVTESELEVPEKLSFYIHDICSVLKQYLTNIPDPLCTFAMYDRFTAVSFEEDSETCSFEILLERLNSIHDLLFQLPEINRKVIEILCTLIKKVASNQDVNKMTISNCGVVFGPVIFRPKEVNSEYIFQIRTHGMLVEHMVNYYEEIFEGKTLTEKPRTENHLLQPSSYLTNSTESSLSTDDDLSSDESVNDNSMTEITDDEEKLNHNVNNEVNDDGKVRFSVLKQIQQKVIGQNVVEDKTLKVGELAPDFTSIDQRGCKYSLYKDSIYQGKKVMLFFYPKAFTENETESSTFRNAFSLFYYANCDVIGVSSDSREAQEEFSKKHAIPFRLLSDTNCELRKLYGVPTVINGLMPSRVTFVISETAEILKVHKTGISHRPEDYTLECLAALSDVLIDEQHKKTRIFRKKLLHSPVLNRTS